MENLLRLSTLGSFVIFSFLRSLVLTRQTHTHTHAACARVFSFSTFQYELVTSHATPGCRLPRVLRLRFLPAPPRRRLRIIAVRCLPGADGRPLSFLLPFFVLPTHTPYSPLASPPASSPVPLGSPEIPCRAGCASPRPASRWVDSRPFTPVYWLLRLPSPSYSRWVHVL